MGEMLRNMVAKGDGGPVDLGADDDDDVLEANQGDAAGRAQAAADAREARLARRAEREAGENSQAIIPTTSVYPVATVDSSPEREGKTKGGKRAASISSSSSSEGRRRSRSREKKKKEMKRERSSSSEGSAQRRKRINNFSSIRNVERERAKTRVLRSNGAQAAVKVMQGLHPLAAGPYFAP